MTAVWVRKRAVWPPLVADCVLPRCRESLYYRLDSALLLCTFSGDILQASDDLSHVINTYKRIVEGRTVNGDAGGEGDKQGRVCTLTTGCPRGFKKY